MFYPWGVWVTAYARRNLFTGIMEFGDDYIYSDTDSIKVRNAEGHKDYIEKYNKWIIDRLNKAMDYHGIKRESIAPKNLKGIPKPLGVWDFDGHYDIFKSIGAKRYLVKYSERSENKKSNRGKVNLTVSGLNKQVCVPYLISKYGKYGIFKHFDNELYVPPEHTGKNTHTYIDTEREGLLTDYLGNVGYYKEQTSVHLEKSDYSLSLSREYMDYLQDIRELEF